MAFTQTDVDTLKAAIGSGAMKVRYADGREITYRSQAELERALKMARDEVAATTGSDKPSRSFVAGF